MVSAPVSAAVASAWRRGDGRGSTTPRPERDVQSVGRQFLAVALEVLAAPRRSCSCQVRFDMSVHGRRRAPARAVREVDHDEVACGCVAQHEETSRRWESLSGHPSHAHSSDPPSRSPDSATARRELETRAQSPSGGSSARAGETPARARAGPRTVRRDRASPPRALHNIATAAARARSRPNVAAARGSSWFSMNRISAPGSRGRPAGVRKHRLGGVVDEPVEEALVVTEVEALLLQGRLHVRVGLGHEQQVGTDRSTCPIRPASTPPPAAARPAVPMPAPEHVVAYEHRHVAAQVVALVPDRDQRVRRPAPRAPARRVQLDDVGPGWETVASPGEDVPAVRMNASGCRPAPSSVRGQAFGQRASRRTVGCHVGLGT